MKKLLSKRVLFLFLLPVFFVFHGYVENFGLITIRDSVFLLSIYLVSGLAIYLVSLLVYKNSVRAGLFSFLLLSVYFFFGAVHDFLKLHATFLNRYIILLPILLVLVIAVAVLLKKAKHSFYRLVFFLNLLFIVFLLADIGGITWKWTHPDPNQLSVYHLNASYRYDKCDSCGNPDIYFLVFDEYSSSANLRQSFNYDNSDLDSFLAQKGFSLQEHSSSNYNFTPFSITSILNMNYINGIKDVNSCTLEDYAWCNNLIRNNEVIQFLASRSYSIVNYSIFDLAGNPSRVTQSLLPVKTKLITEQCLFGRLRRDLGWHFYSGIFGIEWMSEDRIFSDLDHNKRLLKLVKEESKKQIGRPRFIYGHFEMPHPPFYFDKFSQPRAVSTLYAEATGNHIESYVGYIPYTNSKIKELIDTIQKNTHQSAVIILMGDHGYRASSTELPQSHYFGNLNAIYFPDRKYNLLKDSISGVNQFRVIFNTLFNQSFPLLKDSTIFLKDKE